MPQYRVVVRVTHELPIDTFASTEEAAQAIAVGIAEIAVKFSQHAQIESHERVKTEVVSVDLRTLIRHSP